MKRSINRMIVLRNRDADEANEVSANSSLPTRKITLLSIGEVAKRSGVKASALRYYESLGLIQSRREANSQRYYPRAALRRIAFIVFAQKIGYSLEEIAGQLAQLPPDSIVTGEDWQQLSKDRKARVVQKIEALQKLNMDLDHCIGCGCLSLNQCKLSNPDDRAGLNGPGPWRWRDTTD